MYNKTKCYENRGLEMEALYNYSDLPIDVLNIIYTFLCKSKEISFDLKKEIVLYHKLYEIIDIYKTVFSLDEEDGDYYKNWLENDLICMLNDNIPTLSGISTNLLERYPKICVEYLNEKLCPDMLSRRISNLWLMLTDQQKQNLYILKSKKLKQSFF